MLCRKGFDKNIAMEVTTDTPRLTVTQFK